MLSGSAESEFTRASESFDSGLKQSALMKPTQLSRESLPK